MQVYFDIGTPSEVFKILNEEIEKHMEANQNELTGEFACCNFGCAPALPFLTMTIPHCVVSWVEMEGIGWSLFKNKSCGKECVVSFTGMHVTVSKAY